MSKPVVVTMTKDKETKNTFRFSSPQSGDIQGSIYVQKSAGITSDEIKVTVEVA
jgi:hypothetical protein